MAPPTPFSDHTYATVNGVNIDLRIWSLTTDASQAPNPDLGDVDSKAKQGQPWVLYIKGGGFASWTHYHPHPWIVPGFRGIGLPVVSAGYRLAPAVGVWDMVADLEKAYAWCMANLGSILGSPTTGEVKVGRVVIAGESSGGTLAALLAHRLRSTHPGSVAAIVSLYGVLDFTDPRWDPSVTSSPEGSISALSGQWTAEEISKSIRGAPKHPDIALVDAPPFDDMPDPATVMAFFGLKEFEWTDQLKLQGEMFKVLHNDNTLMRTVLGLGQGTAPLTEQEVEVARRASPIYLVDEGEAFPPTALLHGEADEDVPCQESRDMAAKLRQNGVEVLEVYKPGAGHVFDWGLSGPDKEGYAEYIQPILDFVKKQVTV